jgi:hypothetical protein
VAQEIYNSPEAIADRGASTPLPAPTNAEQVTLVTALYETILDRDPETAGLDGWLTLLNSGQSPADVAAEIYNSPEAIADRAAKTPPTN